MDKFYTQLWCICTHHITLLFRPLNQDVQLIDKGTIQPRCVQSDGVFLF